MSKDTTTVVLVRALSGITAAAPDPLATASYTRWDTGSIASIGYLHRWALTQGEHSWLVGAGVGASSFNSRTPGEQDDSALSLRAATELSGPLAGGRYFALLQYSSFRSQIFALGQYDFGGSPFGVELSRLSESTHHQTGLVGRYALDAQRRWWLRAGMIRTPDDTQALVGLAFNAF